MFDITSYSVFVLSVFLLSVTPGPDMAYVIGQSVVNGRRAGFFSASGVALGSCTHALASTLGLTAVIAASPLMFSIVKFLGALYLVFLGAKMILSTFRKQASSPAETVVPVNGIAAGSLLCKGFITTLTNPKVLLFFISFFPQFVTPHGAHQTASFLILGMTYALVAFMVDISCALLAGGASDKFAGNQRLQRVMDRIVGTAFIGLGIRLALTRR